MSIFEIPVNDTFMKKVATILERDIWLIKNTAVNKMKVIEGGDKNHVLIGMCHDQHYESLRGE